MHRALTRFARRYLFADAAPLSPAERRRSTLAALLGVMIFEGVLFVLPVAPEIRRLLAPLGATSVILFVLPHSPLAQPWSVFGGLMLPALTGFACGSWLPAGWLAVGVAVTVSVWLMAWLRCLHPPGGAMAIVMASAAAQGLDAASSLGGAACNALAMLMAATAVNNLIPGRHYPLCSPAPTAPKRPPRSAAGIQHPDLAAALAEIDAYLDVSEDDLAEVFQRAARHAFHRHVLLTCGDVMEAAPLRVDFATGLNEAWRLMQRHNLRHLPVVDRGQRVIGLVGLEDFLRHVTPDDGPRIGDSVRRLLRPTPGTHTSKPEVVGQLMLAPKDGLRCLRTTDGIALAADVLGPGHQPCVPVVDDGGRLAGLVTPTTMTAVLFQHEALDYVRGDAA
ncbi:HPP family protein [Zoogloea sp.]|uniref:HPP family protein n=1 Tax=Zoogloea sp. TaxID=49181 RepID=UPI0035B386C9